MKNLVARFLSETPVVFIGIVLAIAVVFRLGIGAVKTASAEPEPPPPAIHTPLKTEKTEKTEAKPALAPAVAAPVQAEPVVVPDPSAHAPGAIPKRKPRTHGKR